jgi:hypothetical protein
MGCFGEIYVEYGHNWNYSIECSVLLGVVNLTFHFFLADDSFYNSFYVYERWILFILILLCWVFSIVATSACTFLDVTVPYKGADIQFATGFNRFFLPAVIANPAECQSFEADVTGYFGEGNTTAFIFAIANCVLTSLGVAGIFCIQFILRIPDVRDKIWLAMRIIMYCSLWCAVCTFYIRQTAVCDAHECSLGTAGLTQVFNVLCMIVISALLFITECGEESAFDKCRTKTTVVLVPAGTLRTSQANV